MKWMDVGEGTDVDEYNNIPDTAVRVKAPANFPNERGMFMTDLAAVNLA